MKSENFVNWTAVGWLHHPQGDQNTQFWECPDFFEVPGTGKYVMKGSASGDWWSLGNYTQVTGMKEDIFTPISYDVHAGNVQGLGLQKYDFGQFYASKTFYDPAKKRQILWGWVAEEGRAPHQGEDWSSIQSLPRSVLIDPTNTTRLMFPPIDELESLRGAAIAIPTTLVKAGETVDLSKLVPASTGNQLDVELTISGDFTQPNLAAGISVLNSATSDADAQLTTVPVQRLMNNTDMPGDDIIAKHHSPGDPDFGPLPCQAACDALPACKSWTWVVRGTPVGSGDCCLHADVNCPKSAQGLTSGAKMAQNVPCHGPSPSPPETNGNYVSIASNPAATNPEGINLLTLNNGGHVGQSVVGPSTSAVTLRVIVDRSAVEAYSAGGRGVATKRTYPTADMRGVSFVNTGKNDVSITATIYPMATAQPPAMDELLIGHSK